MIIWVYNRWGQQINAIGDFQNLVFDDELGSLDYIEFTTPFDGLNKGDYLVWRDEFDLWHEHIVRSIELKHKKGTVLQKIYAVNSISELNLYYKNERDSYGFSNAVAWQRLLEDTRWTLGTCENLGSHNIKFYHETVYDGLVDLIDIWGGEISTSITVGSSGVTQRRVNHHKQRGSDDGLMFWYGFDADNIERKIELDDVYTRLHVFGKGEPTYDDSGSQTGNGRRLSFASINGGRDYVEDNDAMQTWGVIGANGVRQHSEGVYVFDKCEDANELLSLAKEKLNEVKVPRVTYDADVAILADAGMEFKNARTGDVCYIRDKELDERLSGRITHVKRYITGEKPTSITLGNVKRTISGSVASNAKAIGKLQSSSAKWDGVAEANQAWLQNMQSNLNEMMNIGGGYAYWEEGEGITVYDKPKDQRPTMCIQLKGAGFRIANSKKSNGEWDFKTFGTGDGFTADLMNVGTLVCGTNRIDLDSGTVTLDRGTITDRLGRNTWDMSNGTLKTNYMEANNISAKGTFECGSSTGYRTLLNSSGQLIGYRNGTTQVGYIDYSASIRNVSTGAISYGLNIVGGGNIRMIGQEFSVAAASSSSTTSTICHTGSSESYISKIEDRGGGSIGWTTSYCSFINGMCTNF